MIHGATLALLIQQAYNVRDYQISNGPSWLNINRYDIVAKTSTDAKTAQPAATGDEMRARLQSLLAERFHLQVIARRSNSAYSLVVGKGGSKLTENHSEATITKWIAASDTSRERSPDALRGAHFVPPGGPSYSMKPGSREPTTSS